MAQQRVLRRRTASLQTNRSAVCCKADAMKAQKTADNAATDALVNYFIEKNIH